MTFEDVLNAFHQYIHENPCVDVVQSKWGYVILHLDRAKEIRGTEIMHTPEILLDTLKEEIVLDVLHESKRGHDLENADAEEKAQIRKRTAQYVKQLTAAT